MIIQSCEDPNTVYVCLEGKNGKRYIFREGQYVGWYMP